MEPKYNYYQHQLLNCCPFPVEVDPIDKHFDNGPLKIKIASDVGETKWLGIPASAFLQIERILIELGVQDAA